MSFAVPQTIGPKILKELTALIDSDEQPDRFTLLRLERDAQALVRVDPAQGFIVRSGLAVLQWDIEECRRMVANALRYNSGIDSLFNASISFEKLSLMEEAQSYLERAYQIAPQNGVVVGQYIHGLYTLGRIDQAADLVMRCEREGIELPSDVPNVVPLVAFCTQSNISTDRIQFELSAAWGVLSGNKKRASYLNHKIFVDHDGNKSLVIKVGFVGDLQDELCLEAALAPILADEPGWDPCLLSTEFHYLSKKVEHADEPI